MRVAPAKSSADPEAILFSSFRLDLRAGELTRAGTSIPLRPKTWAVLVHLASRPGLLVTKQDLLDAVWPDVAVTPDTLTKSIGELRLALGDDAAAPHFIATVHRRGFRFVGGPPEARPVAVGTAAWQGGDPGTEPFVARSAELRQLQECFAKACAGERQVVFLTGAAGVGKTRLIDVLLDSHTFRGTVPSLWVARAACVEQHGLREPYMPVLKALERLARRPDAAPLLGLLRRIAPTWLAQMPWLIGDDEEMLRQSLQAARAERMLREFAALTESLTTDVALVLVFEDLHWSDPATVDLLALLAQRRESARLMVIGTYRPAELVVQDHVLGQTVRSLQVRRQCIDLPLHELTEADVHDYLEARFPGAQLPPTLASRVYGHTDGHPLFVVALVDHMLSRGWILQTAPGWSFTPALDTIDLGLPDDARRMIEAQFEALGPADRTLLEAASVAGCEFAPQAIAAPLGRALDEVEVHCETLARSRGFLRFAGSSAWPDGSTGLRYAFIHDLYRQAVYEALPDDARQRLHRRIGECLEAAYGRRTPEIAAELAQHFECGRDYPRALHHLTVAAQRACQRFAGREAIAYLQAAITLATELPDAEERQRCELELRLTLAPIVNDLRGSASDELRENCERARTLCEAVGTPEQLFQVLYALSHVYTVKADATRAPAILAELDDLANRLGGAEYRLLADSVLARASIQAGRFTEARRLVEGPLAPHLRGQVAPRTPAYGADPVVGTNCHYALALWYLGDIERAHVTMDASVDAADLPGVSVFTRAAALCHAAIFEMLRRNPVGTQERATALRGLAGEHGFRFWEAMATALIGWVRVQQGDLGPGLEELETARVEIAATGARIFSTYVLAFLAEGRLRTGEFAAGLAAADQGLHTAERTLDRSYWPELWRLKGELLIVASASGHAEEGEDCLRRAVGLARKMKAKSLELRAGTCLARLLHARGRVAAARAALEESSGWFSAAATGRDLEEARALLAQLAPEAPPPRARIRSGARRGKR